MGGAQASSSSGSSSGSSSSGSSSSGSSSSSAASSGAGGCCDCDHDNDPAKGLCAGTDCDDHDPNAYLGEATYYSMASPVVDFDWDCDGTPKHDPMLDIAIDCPPVGLPCPAGTGFLAKVPPPCGMKADWGTCNQSGAACVKAVIEAMRPMTCK